MQASLSERADRIARNEALVRAVNERVAQVNQVNGDVGSEFVEFLCECGDADCVEAVPLTLDEYESVRASATRFVLRPGHDAPDVERVVAESDRFIVAEKHSGEAQIAKATDPRA
jgi:hypothetical protein